MIEYQRPDRVDKAEMKAASATRIFGLGGAGSNVLDQIVIDGSPNDARLVCVDTDVRTLKVSTAHDKIQLGADLTRGLGAGGDPELGMQAAEETESQIVRSLEGAQMVFICLGLGGGTASGAAPLVCRLAREAGAFVVAFATMPFSFEGRRRLQQAEMALKELERCADALVTFDNDRMGEMVLAKQGIQETFSSADRVISQSIQAVTSVVDSPGLIKLGMDDVLTALKNPDSRCLFGHGRASGKNRVHVALKRALNSPLLDKGKLLQNTANTLVHIVGGPSLTLFEIQDLMDRLTKHVHPDTQILFGTAVDESLDNDISVTVMTSLSIDELHSQAALMTTEKSKRKDEIRKQAEPVAEEPGKEREPVNEIENEVESFESEDSESENVVDGKDPAEKKEQEALGAETKEPLGKQDSETEVHYDVQASNEEEEHESFTAVSEELETEQEWDDVKDSDVAEREHNRSEAVVKENEPADVEPYEVVDLPTARIEVEEEREPMEASSRGDDEALHREIEDEAVEADEPVFKRSPIRQPESEQDKVEGSRATVQSRAGRHRPEGGTGIPPRRDRQELPRRHRDNKTRAGRRPRQEELEFDPLAKGSRFKEAEPTVVDGQNLDVPTIFRKKGSRPQ